MQSERKLYLDNIRAITVLLVLVYHVFYMFNGVGILGGIPNAENIPLFDSFCTWIYPWFMVLLFVVAGIAARYSLGKRGAKRFVRERAVKLLVPSTAGLFVVHWITGYLNIRMGGGLETMPGFLVYPISAISGIGPLWFIQTLFLFSLLIIPLAKADRRERFYEVCGKVNGALILLLFLPIWGASQILNLPVLTMYRFGIYFAAFFIGYFVFSHDEILDRIERMRYLTLPLAVVLSVVYMLMFNGENFASDAVLKHVITNGYLWCAVLAILGFGKKYLDRQNRVNGYLCQNSFGFYILHYPVLITVCYLLHTYTPMGTLAKVGIALVAEFVLTALLNEGIKRIPVVRCLVLGIRKRRTHEVQAHH